MNQGDYRKVGTLSKAHGIRGAFVLYLESDFPDWLCRRKRLFAEINGVMTAWTVRNCKPSAGALVVQVAELEDRNQVEALRGTGLFVTEAEAREAAQAEPDYYYNSDLIGLDVISAGTVVGAIRDVVEMPAQNLLEVTAPSGHVFHIPFVAQLVKHVDLEARTVEVNLPEGLIDLNQAETAN